MYDYLIVEVGLSDTVLGREAAAHGKKCLVIGEQPITRSMMDTTKNFITVVKPFPRPNPLSSASTFRKIKYQVYRSTAKELCETTGFELIR